MTAGFQGFLDLLGSLFLEFGESCDLTTEGKRSGITFFDDLFSFSDS